MYIEYILPPIAGAVIGYITNSIAIKMLFKPYKEWKIFGIRVPFTPGVIPRHREELSGNIGKMIGKILLNKETLQKQLTSSQSHEIIHRVIQNNLESILQYDLPPLAEIIPDKFKDSFLSFYDSLKQKLKQLGHRFLISKDFEKIIQTLLSSAVQDLGEKKINELIDQNTLNNFANKAVTGILNTLLYDSSIENWMDKQFDRLKESQAKLNDFISENAVAVVVEWFQGELDHFLDMMEEAVFESGLDEKLHVKFKTIIFSYLEQLNTVQKFVVNVWGVEERVEDDLPKVIREAISQVFNNLKSDESQEQIIKALLKIIHEQLDKEIHELVSNIDDDNFDNIKSQFKGKIVKALGNPDWQTKIEHFIGDVYSRYQNLPLKTILNQISISHESISDFAVQRIMDFFRQEEKREKLFGIIEEKCDHWVNNHHIGSLNGILSLTTEDKEKLSAYLGSEFLALLNKDISYVVDAVNIQKVVIEKINLFPLDQLENLVLIIVKKHLKWINIFGAILGAIIGGIQIFLR